MQTENRLVVAKGEQGRGGLDWEFGASRCKVLHIKWIQSKVLCIIQYRELYSTSYQNRNGREYEEFLLWHSGLRI